MRRGNPEYDPDDRGRWKAMADDPDHIVCEECGHHASVLCLDTEED